jgi:hypothetical protein
MRYLVAIAAVLPIIAGTPAISRADKAVYSDEKLAKFAERLKLSPLSKSPDPGAYDVSLEIAPGLDRRIVMLGKACNHGAVPATTMVAPLVERFAGRWDVGGNLATSSKDAPQLKLRIDSSESTERCVEVGELKFTCFLRTRIGGAIVTRGANAETMVLPVESDLERQVPFAPFCLNVINSDEGQQAGLIYQLLNNDDKGGIAVVNREAVIAFITNADSQLKKTMR